MTPAKGFFEQLRLEVFVRGVCGDKGRYVVLEEMDLGGVGCEGGIVSRLEGG
jgi:hypothetical protein